MGQARLHLQLAYKGQQGNFQQGRRFTVPLVGHGGKAVLGKGPDQQRLQPFTKQVIGALLAKLTL